MIAGCTDAGCPLVQDNIQRLAVTLYTELLSRLVSLINRYSAVQCSTVQYSAVQCSTVQYSIVQHSTSPGASSPTTSTLLQSYSSTLPASRTPTLLVRRRTVIQSSHHYLYCIVSGEQPAAGFVDLCYNYLQERLQKLFIESQLEKLSEKEKEIAKVKDNVKGHFSSSLLPLKLVIAKKTTSAPLINLIDRTSSVQEQPQSSWAPGSR